MHPHTFTARQPRRSYASLNALDFGLRVHVETHPSQRLIFARGGVSGTTAPYYSNEAAQWTSFTYDAWDRLVRTDLPDGNHTSVSYGLWSSTTTDENGKSTTARRNSLLETQQERTLGGQPVTTTSSYDLLGRLVAMTDNLGHQWSWTFDSLGRNTQKADPDAGTWSFAYDDAGRLTSQTDAKAQTTTFGYDTVGRLTTKANGAGTVTTAYSEARTGFFNKGFPTTITSPSSVLKLDYDALGRSVKQNRTLDAVDYVLTRTYDSGGFLRGITYPDGDAVGTTQSPLVYDAAGRLKGVPSILTSVSYNASGQPLVQTNANGTVTTKAYSATRGFLTNIGTLAGSATIQNLQYTLDPAGLVTTVTSPVANEGWSYSYDDLYRLTQSTNTSTPAETQSWTYDAIGRITNNSRIGNYTYPTVGSARPHAPQTAGSNSYVYDPNGNMYSGAGRSLTWDANNRVTQATVGSTTVSSTYDAFGEQLKKTTATSTSLYPFGDDYEITNGVVTKYVGAKNLALVAKRVGTGGSVQTYWLHTDRLGSIQAITDATGAEVFRRKYRPYGETLAQSGNATESRGWISERNDSETGLTYLHARYYDAALGTFISPDPMHPARPGVGTNRFSYAFGNPLGNADRSGLCVPIPPATYCEDVEVVGEMPGDGGSSGGGGRNGNGAWGGGGHGEEEYECGPNGCDNNNGDNNSGGGGCEPNCPPPDCSVTNTCPPPDCSVTNTCPPPAPQQPTPQCKPSDPKCSPDTNGDGKISPAETKAFLRACEADPNCLKLGVMPINPSRLYQQIRDMRNLAKAFERRDALRELLEDATGPRSRGRIQAELEGLEKWIGGHIKKITRKWGCIGCD